MQTDFRAIRCEDWDYMLAELLVDKKGIFSELNQVLNTGKLSVKNSGISYRLMNHWASLGIIRDNRRGKTSQWRKLSLLDIIFIRVIVELRKFGLSLDSIKKCSEAIYLNNLGKSKISYLEIGINFCFNHNKVSLIVFSDGHCEVLRENDLTFSKITGFLTDSHLVIDLNKICHEILKTSYPSVSTIPQQLSDKEARVIELLRSGNLDKLYISISDNEPKSLDSVIKTNKNINIQQIINDISFGQITIKKANGRWTSNPMNMYLSVRS